MTYSPDLQALLDTVPLTNAIRTEDIAFAVEGQEFAGFVARPDDEAAHPGVLIFSDWGGLGPHAKVRAEMLARLGYVAYAGDIYGDGLAPENPGETAGRFYGDTDLFRARAAANLSQLKADVGIDDDRIAVIGYCFGGSGALELARAGADVAGVVSFHGNLATGAPAAQGAVAARILVLTGAADPVVPDDSVIAFENELREAGAPDWQLTSYSGAMHAFTMPGTDAPAYGAQFNPVANARSWVAMRNFFDEIFAA